MIRQVLAFVRSRLKAVDKAPPSDYKDGSRAELREVEEFIEDLMWDEGVDDE